MDKLTFRDAVPTDAKLLTEVSIASKRYWGYDEELMSLWIPELTFTAENISSRSVSVAQVDSSIVGVSVIIPHCTGCEIDGFWIDPKQIGKGIGRKFFDYTLSLAAKKGYSTATIVSDPNAASFYAKMGAVQVGTQESTPAGRFLPVFEVILRPEPFKAN